MKCERCVKNDSCEDCSDWEMTGGEEMNEIYEKNQNVKFKDGLSQLSRSLTIWNDLNKILKEFAR